MVKIEYTITIMIMVGLSDEISEFWYECINKRTKTTRLFTIITEGSFCIFGREAGLNRRCQTY